MLVALDKMHQLGLSFLLLLYILLLYKHKEFVT